MLKQMNVAIFGFLPLMAAACDQGALNQDTRTDGQYDVALSDKADGVQLTACHEAHILSLLNDPATTVASLRAVGVNSTAATNLMNARITAAFATMLEVDAVYYVGPTTFDQLRLAVDAQCTVVVPPDPNAPVTTISAECVLAKLLAWVNSPATTVEQMVAAGVAKRAATEVVNARTAGRVFASLKDLDAVPQVGEAALAAFQKAVEPQCIVVVDNGDDGEGDVSSHGIEVIFSPQLSTESHLARVVELIDDAKTSIDIAMYSLSDGNVREAVGRAVKRGVSARMVYDGANTDKGAGTAMAGTTSAKFEDLGVDVRYINKIMHHKFVLIDGPRTGTSEAASGILITGSGNWSSSAATRYDENTMFFEGHAALNLAFQEEFNLLWNNSRDFIWNAALSFFASTPVSETMVEADPTAQAFFTSTNFRTYVAKSGPTFAVVAGNNTVADRLVALIQGATRSIHIASAHIRSRPIAEALMAKQLANPEVEIQVVLDGQEYVSDWAQNEQEKAQASCLTAAGTSTSKIQACYDVGYKYGNDLDGTAGIELRYKWYAYRWDYSYAKQMHHKYTIVDGRWIATGSYNYSDNAEHGTMDNMVVLDGASYPELAVAFEKNFSTLFLMGEASGAYQAKLAEVQTGTQPFRITFDAMALTTDQITTLKRAMKAACKDIDTERTTARGP